MSSALLLPSDLPPGSHLDPPLALIPSLHRVPLLPAVPPGYVPLGGFLLYRSSHSVHTRALNLREYSSLRLFAVPVFLLGRVSFSLSLSLLSNNLWPPLDMAQFLFNMSVLVNPHAAYTHQALCPLMVGPIPKCISVIPKERREWGGLGRIQGNPLDTFVLF